ncbi:gas vesicle accessory protein GvpU [Halobacillus sp. A5]|uniref:gas vesicle accessory protein GvpU n=1 Tax=Halobacillus sp. A5 TaxID=2880263 RepID=UPI0020A65B8A|nr:gas vesicle accessory protein GvpU [Halobacillus sp. A5]MCP3026950.1 gas vesicle protein GvpU [Halobacillus sp. A5]
MDDVLVTFVKAANNHDFSLDITLNIKGALVSGTTISAEEYLDGISHKFEEGNDVSQAISEKLAEASESAKEESNGDVSFIHLKNAQVFNGDSEPTPSDGEFQWRGKIDEVDGFFLGRISS